jgi:hypothetical protein
MPVAHISQCWGDRGPPDSGSFPILLIKRDSGRGEIIEIHL